jgi:hypothetical protein
MPSSGQAARVVFLDRDTLPEDIGLRRFDFPHELVEFGATSPADVGDRIAGADIVITNKVPIRREAIAAAPNLRPVAIAATGSDPAASSRPGLRSYAERGRQRRFRDLPEKPECQGDRRPRRKSRRRPPRDGEPRACSARPQPLVRRARKRGRLARLDRATLERHDGVYLGEPEIARHPDRLNRAQPASGQRVCEAPRPRWPLGPVKVPLSTGVPAAAIMRIVSWTIGS